MHRVFYEGETVRSRFHGLGEVSVTGEHPRVLFLDGRERSVPGDTIMLVPPEMYDAEVRNRMLIERFLTLRIYGSAPSHAASLPRPEFDLTAAMMWHALPPPVSITDSALPDSGVLYFD